MYSIKELEKALLADPPKNSGLVFYPMGTIIIGMPPQKMKLLLLLGLTYGLVKNEWAPDLIKVYLKGCIVDIGPFDSGSPLHDGIGLYKKLPKLINPIEKVYALAGPLDYAVYADGNSGRGINLQHFLGCDVIEHEPCRSEAFSKKFQRLCESYCLSEEVLANYVTWDGPEWFMNYHAVLKPQFGIQDWAEMTGACKEIRNFAKEYLYKKPHPEDFDKYEFRLSMVFGQIERKYELALITANLWGNGGKIELFRGLYEFIFEKDLLIIVEDILKKLFPGHKGTYIKRKRARHFNYAITLCPGLKPPDSPDKKELQIMEQKDDRQEERLKRL